MMIFIRKVAGLQTQEEEDALVIPDVDPDDLWTDSETSSNKGFFSTLYMTHLDTY